MNLKERYLAIREGHFNAASQEYFAARPHLDTAENRRIFYGGHCKGYDAATQCQSCDGTGSGGLGVGCTDCLGTGIDPVVFASRPKPIDMLLYCPNCGVQHIDAPSEKVAWDDEPWTNPPHRSHLCANPDCGCIWRPADVPTNGVEAIKTEGKNDSWPGQHNDEVIAALAKKDKP